MFTNLSIVSFMLAVRVLMVVSDEPPQSDKDPLDFGLLVAQLASPNEAPLTNNRRTPHVKFPSSYDREAQKNVLAARQLLYEHFADALPELVAAMDDQRYSMTIDWAEGDGYYNKSVGAVCKNIIASQIEVYRAKIQFSGPRHWHKYTYPFSKEWWEKNKEKSHREMQIVAIEWAIDQSKNETGFVRDERKNELDELIRFRERLASSDKPMPGQRMYRTVSQDK